MITKFSLEAKIAVCEALGLDAKHILNDGLNIRIPARGVPTVTVTLAITDEKMRSLAKVLKGFELTERWKVPLKDE